MKDIVLIQQKSELRKILLELLKYNKYSAAYALSLTKRQALEIVKTRAQALQNNGRIEFKEDIYGKMILAFCSSQYVTKENYADTLMELIEIFYYFKNEMMDQISDEELIQLMQRSFNGICCGSLELLRHRELERIAQLFRDKGIRFDPGKINFTDEGDADDAQ